MSPKKVIFRVHAIERMFQQGISAAQVEQVLARGEQIRAYPEDKPYPSRLILGWIGDRPLHVVAADNTADGETIIITVYEPDPMRWDPSFRRRIKG